MDAACCVGSAAAAVAVAACGGGLAPQGSVRFALTDVPACGFEQVNITIERLREHANANADENTPGWTDLRFDPARKIDLLRLRNGVLTELGELSLASGW